jgi:hypothetical protein
VSLHALRPGHYVKTGGAEFRNVQRLPERKWQLQNATTGEWCVFEECDLLDRFSRNELSFLTVTDNENQTAQLLPEKLMRDLGRYPVELVDLAK